MILEKDLYMQKIIVLVVFFTLGMLMSGCSKTWSGVKHDTGKAWDTSKKAVHNATA